MARINFPSVFNKVVTLFKKVFAKHTADGAASVLTAYLNEQSIVMADDNTDVDAAVLANENFDKKEKLMEEKSELRDDLFETPFEEHLASVQLLKKLFRGNVTKLGEWGVTVDARGRVVYATDFSGKATEVLTFIAKHQSFPLGTSPLKTFLTENEIDLVANKTKVQNAQTAHTDFTTAETDKEQFREERDTLLAPVEGHLRGIGQYLVSFFPKTPKKAGQWGFVVDDSARAAQESVKKIPITGIKTVKNVDVGSLLANNGPNAFNVFSGTGTSGNPIIVQPGKKFLVMKSFGTLTIQNPSDTAEAIATVFINR